MTEYSVEEVRALSCELRASGDNLPSANDCNKAADMLTAYAERIAADDGAVVVAHRFLGPDGSAVTEWDDGMPDNGKVFPHLCPPVASVQYAYAHPPAQAAQVDRSALLQAIKDEKAQWTGDYRQAAWFALDQMMTRLEAPPAAEPTAHPTTNSP